MANGTFSDYSGLGRIPTSPSDFGTEFEYLLSPLQQYNRYVQRKYAQGIPQYQPTEAQMAAVPPYVAPEYTAPDWSPYVRTAMSRGFQPAYSMYQYYEPLGAYGTFSDYLASAGQGLAPITPTQTQVRNLATQAAGMGENPFTAASDPVRYQLYYGEDDALQRQMRLATLDALMSGQTITGGQTPTNRTTSPVYNPVLYNAASGAIENLYSNYLATGAGDFGSRGPTGFLNYYLRQRDADIT